MNARQRVINSLKRKGPLDRIPFEISWGAFTPTLMKIFREKTGSGLTPDEYFDFDTRYVTAGPSNMTPDYKNYYSEKIPDNVIFSEWGVGHTSGKFQHFIEIKYHPLSAAKDVKDIENYLWPDLHADYRYDIARQEVIKFHDRGYPVMGEMYATVFETAWQLRGMENLMTDFYLNEDIASLICNRIGNIREKQAVKLAMAGVDILRLGDDVAMQTGPMISPDIYRKFIKEPARKIIEAAKKVNPEILIFMHCDGKIDSFIDDYIEIGVDILNPVQPECNDLRKIKTLYGNRISFWGGIGTQSLMPFGSADDVKIQTQKTIEIMGENGGFLIAPSHILEPEVPWENIISFIETVKKQ